MLAKTGSRLKTATTDSRQNNTAVVLVSESKTLYYLVP